MKEVNVKTFRLGTEEASFETGKLALLANGSVFAKWGDTVILVTVTMSKPREGIDFFPLSVEYIEKMYASGIISSSRFIKRERHPSTDATLKARVIDRSVRPLFPKGFKNEVQVIVNVMSYDGVHDPAILGVNAVSATLMVSDVPFEGPVAGIRVAKVGEELVVNPDIDTYESSEMDLVISASKDSVIMLEAGANQIDESVLLKALELAQKEALSVISAQESFAAECGKEKIEFIAEERDAELIKIVNSKFREALKDAVYLRGKEERSAAMDAVTENAYAELEGEVSKSVIDTIIHEMTEDIVVKGIIYEDRRPDGRGFDEIRPLSSEVAILPRTHGSGLFKRGLTQCLSTVTLGSGKQEQLLEDLEGESTKRYMHHYNFKSFCVGETGRYSYYPGRREIGHGALGEKGLLPVIPSKEEFPYTIRVVSEILTANGSTSMAATCGSTLALLDAGVPIKAPVAGIAMGLVKDEDSEKMVVLTDIQGFEDHFGDMDFKVTGTRKGVTAMQMDNKLKGIPMEVLAEALEKAKIARNKILDLFDEVIPAPRTELSQYAPGIETVKINPEKIGELIGPGGKMIRQITEDSGAEIDIEEDGTVNVYSTDQESIKKAMAMIKGVVFEPEVGGVYDATVSRIENYGAFVEITPSVSGLIHVSELTHAFVKDPNEIVKLGQKVKVKVIGVDEKGRVNLSMKALEEKKESDRQERREER